MAPSHTAMPATAETVNRHRIAERLASTSCDLDKEQRAQNQVHLPRLSVRRAQAEARWAALVARGRS